MGRFVVDTFVVWYEEPRDLVRALLHRPCRIFEIREDDDGRLRLVGLVCGNGGGSSWQ